MKIYQIQKNMNRRAERYAESAGLSGLKIAAGGEDIVTITDEAINSFRRDKTAKNREQDLIKLALLHINDHSTLIDGLQYDHEFAAAEKLVNLSELVIRVTHSVKENDIYGWVTGFVIEQLAGEK